MVSTFLDKHPVGGTTAWVRATRSTGAPTPTLLLHALLDSTAGPVLPPWSYRTWWHVLHYPDLSDRAHRATKDLGCQRDAVLAHPAVRRLVEWAGHRRHNDPVTGVAAAMVALHAARELARSKASSSPGVAELVQWLATAVDTAQPLRPQPVRRDAFLVDPERLAAAELEPTVREHPRLVIAVGRLLRLAGAPEDRRLHRRVEGAVVQAGDWWARHAREVPADVAGLDLPGIIPAQELRAPERLAAAVSETELLALVAGPHPGRGRPGQVAWRRGLTYWVAVDLATGGIGHAPGATTLRWWRSALADVSTSEEALSPGAKMVAQPA